MKVKWIILVAAVCVVLCGLVNVDSIWASENFDEFVQDSERKAAAGDKTSELMVKGVESLEKNGDISGVDPKLILEVYLPKAEAGDAVAEYFVGMVYYQRNEMKEAAHWLELAAEQGNKEANFYIAGMYIGGQGVEKNLKKVEKYMKKAAEQGNVLAEAAMSGIYDRGGDGIPVDKAKACYWAQNAADDGNAQSQLYMSVAYRDGIGVEVDYGKAQKYLELAAVQLDDPVWWGELGAYYLNLYNQYDGVKVDQEKGYKFLKISVDSGNPGAQSALATMYLNGSYVKQNYKKAYNLYLLATDQGFEYAFIALGLMFERGLYVEKNVNKAIEYYKKGAENGDIRNFEMLGEIYEQGRGVDKDLDKAKHYYNKGAELGDDGCKERLSILSAAAKSMDNK